MVTPDHFQSPVPPGLTPPSDHLARFETVCSTHKRVEGCQDCQHCQGCQMASGRYLAILAALAAFMAIYPDPVFPYHATSFGSSPRAASRRSAAFWRVEPSSLL